MQPRMSVNRSVTAQKRLEAGLPVSWTFDAPAPWISANQRHHWRAKADQTRRWRQSVRTLARRDGVPTGLDRLHITIMIHQQHPKKQRDVGNLQPTAKAIIDGLVEHGLLPDDNDKHLTGPDLRRGTDGPPAVTIHMIHPEKAAARSHEGPHAANTTPTTKEDAK